MYVWCVCVWGGGRTAVMQSTLRWEADGRCVCVWGGGGGRTAVMQSTLRCEDGRCVWVGVGWVERQSCSQHCAGRMGAVCGCVYGGWVGLERQSCSPNTALGGWALAACVCVGGGGGG